MTGDVGLPYEQRVTVAELLHEAFRELGDRPNAEQAADVTIRLLAAVDELGRAAGLFELAAAAVVVIGGPPQIPGVSPVTLRYVGYGPTARQAQPQSPLDYQVAAFGTAIMAHDRPAAWKVFAPLAPADGEPPRQQCADFIATLVRNAWSRHRGGDLQISIPPDENVWPPVCDFCCHDPAAWMWYCRGGDVRIRLSTGTSTVIRFDDMEFWYGCDTCRPMVASPHPNWSRVFARQKQFRPDAHRPSVLAMYEAFQFARRAVDPVPLPAARPTPTPGRT